MDISIVDFDFHLLDLKCLLDPCLFYKLIHHEITIVSLSHGGDLFGIFRSY